MEHKDPKSVNAGWQPNESKPAEQQVQTIPVMAEFVTVNKEVVDTGKVIIKKTVTEEQARVNLPIINESYDIERIPVNEVRDTPPPSVRYEGDVMIIPVTKEITVIQKRYEVIEELRITRKVTETPTMQEITLLKEQVHVERRRNNEDDSERF